MEPGKAEGPQKSWNRKDFYTAAWFGRCDQLGNSLAMIDSNGLRSIPKLAIGICLNKPLLATY